MEPTITFIKNRGHVWPNEAHCFEGRGERSLTFPLGELAWRCCASWNDIADPRVAADSLPDVGNLCDEYGILLERSESGWFVDRFGDQARRSEMKAWEDFSNILHGHAEGMPTDRLIDWFVGMNDPASISGWRLSDDDE